MRFLSLGLVAIIAPFHAHAADDDALAKAVGRCWKPPASMREAKALDAVIDERGEGKFRVPGHDQTKIASNIAADSLLRAAMRCAPYDVPAGRYRLTVTPHDPFEE